MSVDTPARIAVLGAGPIGLEAALYARFLGYDVDIYEQGAVAESVRCWGHVRMFTPFSMNASPLGLAALAAQDASYRPPNPGDLLTGHEYVERYLLPLSQTDLLEDHLRLQTQVLGVARHGMQKDRPVGKLRQSAPFELLVNDHHGQRFATADAVIDATGTYETFRRMGPGGLPALGELEFRSSIHYQLPDILGAERDRFAACRTLVVGDGPWAAAAVVALAELAEDSRGTQVIWVTPTECTVSLAIINDDPIPARASLMARALSRVREACDSVRHRGSGTVRRVSRNELTEFEIELEYDRPTGGHVARDSQADERGANRAIEVVRVDHVLALVGYRADTSITGELPVDYCYATEAPTHPAARLIDGSPEDRVAQIPVPGISVTTTEPRFHILGSKRYGRRSDFLIAVGFSQIQQLFCILADRHDLDLYANMQHLQP